MGGELDVDDLDEMSEPMNTTTVALFGSLVLLFPMAGALVNALAGRDCHRATQSTWWAGGASWRRSSWPASC